MNLLLLVLALSSDSFAQLTGEWKGTGRMHGYLEGDCSNMILNLQQSTTQFNQ